MNNQKPKTKETKAEKFIKHIYLQCFIIDLVVVLMGLLWILAILSLITSGKIFLAILVALMPLYISWED
jgi:hypothetical protein